MGDSKLPFPPPQAAPDDDEDWETAVEAELARLAAEVARINHGHVKVAGQVAQLYRERRDGLDRAKRGGRK
jgi:hypothetical protein